MIRYVAVLLLTLLLPSLVMAQQKDKEDYVAIPSDIILLTIASPPGCPVQFENARLLFSVQRKSLAFSADIRNTSAKAITYWQPMFWTSRGTGGTLSSETLPHGKILLPGEIFHEGSPEVVALTPELRRQLNVENYRGTMVALMVNSVVFADGSRYENPSFVATVRSYFERLADDLNRLEHYARKYEKREK